LSGFSDEDDTEEDEETREVPNSLTAFALTANRTLKFLEAPVGLTIMEVDDAADDDLEDLFPLKLVSLLATDEAGGTAWLGNMEPALEATHTTGGVAFECMGRRINAAN